MSLHIDVNRIDAVLLADGWRAVHKKSFDLDSYEYHHADLILLAGGREKPLITATGRVPVYAVHRGSKNASAGGGPAIPTLRLAAPAAVAVCTRCQLKRQKGQQTLQQTLG